jgi:hypothetical protein
MQRLAFGFLHALLAHACGGPTEHQRPDRCDATVLGSCVVSDGPLDATHLERTLRLALGSWSASDDALAGWAIVFKAGIVTCNGAPAAGCTYLDGSRVIEVQALDPECLETAQLVHELGHALHGDTGHAGPWWSWAGEQTQTWSAVRSPGASPGCAASRYYVHRP